MSVRVSVPYFPVEKLGVRPNCQSWASLTCGTATSPRTVARTVTHAECARPRRPHAPGEGRGELPRPLPDAHGDRSIFLVLMPSLAASWPVWTRRAVRAVGPVGTVGSVWTYPVGPVRTVRPIRSYAVGSVRTVPTIRSHTVGAVRAMPTIRSIDTSVANPVPSIVGSSVTDLIDIDCRRRVRLGRYRCSTR